MTKPYVRLDKNVVSIAIDTQRGAILAEKV